MNKIFTIQNWKGHDTEEFDPTKETDVKKIKDIICSKLRDGYILYVKEKGKEDLIKVGGKELTMEKVDDSIDKVYKIIVAEDNLIIGLKSIVKGG